MGNRKAHRPSGRWGHVFLDDAVNASSWHTLGVGVAGTWIATEDRVRWPETPVLHGRCFSFCRWGTAPNLLGRLSFES